MEKENQQSNTNNLLSSLLGIPEDTHFKPYFNLRDNSILKIAWHSPNDNKSNLFNMLVDFKDPALIRIKDNH